MFVNRTKDDDEMQEIHLFIFTIVKRTEQYMCFLELFFPYGHEYEINDEIIGFRGNEYN